MKRSGILMIYCLLMYACQVKPRAIVEGTDECAYCKMTVMEKQYAAEYVTGKGRFYVFDDIKCMQQHLAENQDIKQEVSNIFVTDFYQPDILLNAEDVFYFTSDVLHSPMNGNIVALSTKQSLDQIKTTMQGEDITWDEIIK